MKKRALGASLGILFLLATFAAKADLFVPGGYPTIQSAINAAAPGDVIHLAGGMYPETLTIAKSLSIIGSGTNNCTVYSCPTNGSPLISITGPAAVTLSGFTLVGGNYLAPPLNYYNGFTPLGIVSTNATLTLNSMVINQIQNYFVTVTGGSLFATNVDIWTQDFLVYCDVGFQLNGCVAIIDGLAQNAGRIDHTISVNPSTFTNFADVTVLNSSIRASQLDYGNCIRTYVDTKLVVTNCLLYRGAPGSETVVSAPGNNHNGIGINGYSNAIVIVGNTFSNLPCAIYCGGSVGGNQVVIQDNLFTNSVFNGIALDSMSYKAVDLGGGALGSTGGNVFAEAASTNYSWDVFYTNLNGVSPANIFAVHNTWSNPTNKAAVIYDHLKNPAFGRLVTDALTLNVVAAANGHTVLSWNERGAGEHYTIETSGGSIPLNWTAAPGAWPITNPGLSPMFWTNPLPRGSNIFYRIKSVVP
jgi:hypothetical protein